MYAGTSIKRKSKSPKFLGIQKNEPFRKGQENKWQGNAFPIFLSQTTAANNTL